MRYFGFYMCFSVNFLNTCVKKALKTNIIAWKEYNLTRHVQKNNSTQHFIFIKNP